MINLIKCLSLVLVGFLAYDTVNFVLTNKTPTQVEIRPETPLAEIKIHVPEEPDVTSEDGGYWGAAFFVFAAAVAGVVVVYYFKVTGKYERHCNDAGALALRRVPEEPFMAYFYEDGPEGDNRLANKFSELQLTLVPNLHSDEDVKDAGDEDVSDWRGLDENAEDIIDVNLLRSNDERRRSDYNRENLMGREADSSPACACNLEQFEERLGAVEHGLKSSSEATKEWSKRIEQAEVDLVNLHRQMYTILSNAEFVPPSSELFAKNAGDSTPLDFYDPALYKVPDIIVETKKELERGDLFRNSLTKQSNDDNWGTEIEEEPTEKKENGSRHSLQFQRSESTATTDPIKIKESLLRKNEELKEKTRKIMRAMEDAVRATHARKSKGVHSHYVQPYRRIQHADADNSTINKSKQQ